MAGLQFTKMHGAGNDYVFLDAFDPATHALLDCHDFSVLARRVSNRNFGIGSDGLIVLAPARDRSAAFAMWMWNSDGSRGSMCGNGLRCLVKLACDHGRVQASEFVVETDAGPRRATALRAASGAVTGARIEMGLVTSEREPRLLEALGRTWSIHVADAGNPHAVIFVSDVELAPVDELGAMLQAHPWFRGGVNVEFVEARADGTLVQRTFERGSGETLACGTGACAVASIALSMGRVHGPRIRLQLRGGELSVIVQAAGSLVLEGPAVTVFEGEFELS